MKVFFSQSFESKGKPFSGQSGLYASVVPVYGTRDLWSRLTDTFKKFEVIPEPEDELHVTLMYSREHAPDVFHLENMFADPLHSIHAKPSRLEYWNGHDNDGYVVLHLESEDLHRRHAHYKEIGCTHSFEDYAPHMTVVKGLDNTPDVQAAIDEINKHLQEIEYRIVLGGEAFSDIKEKT